jgi:hypothetical protein
VPYVEFGATSGASSATPDAVESASMSLEIPDKCGKTRETMEAGIAERVTFYVGAYFISVTEVAF